jgi:hypothetical protein
MTDGKFPNTYEPLPHAAPRRRWWEKQRFIIPIAVAVLAPAVFFVTGLVAGDGAGSQQAELSAAQVAGSAAEPAPGAAVPDDPPGDAGDTRDEPATGDGGGDGPDADTDAAGSDAAGSDVAVVASADSAQADEPEPPAVCGRILALREQFEMQGVNPLEVYLEMLEIQKEADGTSIAAAADHAVRTMEDFVSGETDSGDVVAAGTALVAAC